MAYINGKETMFSARIGAGLSIDEIRELCFPVGITISCDTSPAQWVGGTWEQIKDRALVGAGGKYAVGSTGGVESNTLVADNLPPHNHRIYIGQDSSNTHEISNLVNSTFKSTCAWNSTYTEQTGKYKNASGSFVNWGSTVTPINNMMPYRAENIWHRIA